MARQAAAAKAEEKAVEVAVKEATGTTEVKEQEVEQVKAMNIVEAMELAESGKKVRRSGWSKELAKHYIEIPRGQTVPLFTTGNHPTPYQPSVPDMMIHDWEKVGE